MDANAVIEMTRHAFVTMAILVGPVVLAAMLVGTLMSLLQAITQVQDQAISFVPKLAIVGFVLLALMPWMTEYYVEYARDLITNIPATIVGG